MSDPEQDWDNPDYYIEIKSSEFNRARSEMYYAGAATGIIGMLIIGIIFFAIYPY